MAIRFSQIPRNIWQTPSFKTVTSEARTAAMYLLTNEHGNNEGFYRLPVTFASYELGWSAEKTTQHFHELVAAGFLEVDTVSDLVLLPGELEANPPKGGPRLKGAVNSVAGLPDSPLRSRFLQVADGVCPALSEALRDSLGWVSEVPVTPLDTPSMGYSERSDTPSRQQEPEQEQEQEQTILSDPDGSDDTDEAKPVPFEVEFDAAWAHYPRKDQRKASLKAYQARRRSGATAEQLLEATKAIAATMAAEGRMRHHIQLGSTFYGPDEHWLEALHPPATPAGPAPQGDVGLAPFAPIFEGHDVPDTSADKIDLDAMRSKLPAHLQNRITRNGHTTEEAATA